MSALIEKLLPQVAGEDDGSFGALRRKAQKVLMKHGFPHRKTENWKYLPLGLLESSRQHYLSELNANTSHYESRFCLRGPLAPLVSVLLGAQLRRGFREMTLGIVARASERSAEAKG